MQRLCFRQMNVLAGHAVTGRPRSAFFGVPAKAGGVQGESMSNSKSPPSSDATPSKSADAQGNSKGGKVSLSRLMALAKPELRLLIPGTVALFIGVSGSLLVPVLLGRAIDDLTAASDPSTIDRVALLVLVVFAISGLATAARSFLFTVAGERVVARLRADLFAALVGQEVGFFDQQRTGELTNRLASDTTVIQNAVTVNVSMALRFALSILGSLVVLLYYSWQLTALMLLVVPFVAGGAGFYGRMLRTVSKQVQDALARASSVAEESLSGIRTVRAFAREKQEVARYRAAVEDSFQVARTRARMAASFTGLVTFLGYGALVLVLWWGGRMLASGEISSGDLLAFLMLTLSTAFSIGALAGLWQDFAKALGASERVFELIDRQPGMRDHGERREQVVGRIELDHVDFTYPSRPDAPVLQSVSLVLEPGEVVALVGPSGSGKSTIAALLSRFYDPLSGHIRFDGAEYPSLDVDWLREQVGVVSQEPVLFATTIADNIRYGRPGASMDEVHAAARAANAYDFIMDFPEGFQTAVGERGIRLSGGQKQRVAIARALLKDPRVLILDEATSALDTESEHLVQEALDRLMQGRTTLVIAHRLSTIQGADRVVVMERGKVVEEGNHASLLAAEGLYRRLVERQFAS
jgi:ABC transporter fused permease/ATP-binding protein